MTDRMQSLGRPALLVPHPTGTAASAAVHICEHQPNGSQRLDAQSLFDVHGSPTSALLVASAAPLSEPVVDAELEPELELDPEDEPEEPPEEELDDDPDDEPDKDPDDEPDEDADEDPDEDAPESSCVLPCGVAFDSTQAICPRKAAKATRVELKPLAGILTGVS